MNSRILIAFSRGAQGLTSHEMAAAIDKAQEEKNEYWDSFLYDLNRFDYFGSTHSYHIPDGVEIDMRAQKITNMPIDEQGNFIKLYLPKDWDKK